MVTSNAASGYVAKMGMLRLNVGSGKLSSCMLSIGRGPKAVQGKGAGCPPLPCSHLGPSPMLSMHELSLSMPEPMLSLSMLILAKSGQGLTSGWIPLGPVRARRGSSGTRMGPYLSRTPIRVHRVIRQGPSGPIGTCLLYTSPSPRDLSTSRMPSSA